jgi:hypothetical protein
MMKRTMLERLVALKGVEAASGAGVGLVAGAELGLDGEQPLGLEA